MPVFNERATVEKAIDQVLGSEFAVDGVELIVVDDGSTDGTTEVLRRLSSGGAVRLLRHDRNRGKGAAVRTGLREARSRWSVIMDADLEYQAADVRRLIKPLAEGEAEAVFGVRGFQSHSAYG